MLKPTVKEVITFFPGTPKKITKIVVPYKRTINKKTITDLYKFIRKMNSRLEPVLSKHVIVGLSGGIDSTVTALLCRNALGKKNVTAVIVDLGVPEHVEQTAFAKKIAKKLDINYKVVNASQILKETVRLVTCKGPFPNINIVTRIIHSILFQESDAKIASVVSAVDKSEMILARHMEYFYGHFAPLADFYKMEIYDIARLLNIPEAVMLREPGCVESWFDKDVFGVSYEVLDPIIFLMSCKKWTAKRIAQKYNIDEVWLSKIEFRVKHQHWRMITTDYKL